MAETKMVPLKNGGMGVPRNVVLTVFDWAYYDASGEHYARTPERAKQLITKGIKLTPVYTIEEPLEDIDEHPV